LQERLDRVMRSRGPEGADRYVTELQRHAIESVEREVRWLTDLIAAEREGPTAQSAPPVARPVKRAASTPGAKAPKTKTPPKAPAATHQTDHTS
jgi:hypothetical protein